MMMQTFGTYNREIMKTKAIQLLCILCAASLLSCEKEKEAPDGLVNAVFSASFDESSQEFYSEDGSKTYRSGSSTLWSAGDQINVFYGNSTSSTFTLTSGNGTASAQFAGLAPAGKTANYAVYPAGATASRSSDTVVNVTILENQTGTFASCNYAVSCIHSGNELYFSNIAAMLCIQASDAARTIVVESVGGNALCGTLPVTCSSGTVSVGAATSTGSSITVSTSGSGKKYIAILGGVRHAKGLKFTFQNSSGVTTGTYYLDKDFTPAKDHVYNFGEFEPTKAYYVTVSGAGKGNGLSWANAMSASQMWNMVSLSGAGVDASKKAALIDAINGATFHLGAGTYNFGADPTININESSAVSLTFKGGYPAAPSNGASQNLSAASQRAVFSGADTHQVLILNGKLNVSLEGVNIENGLVSSDETGSLHIVGSNVVVSMSYCDVKNNTNQLGYDNTGDAYHYWGAGIWTRSTNFTADHVTFSGNKAYGGAALEIANGSATLTNCSFSGNDVYMQGGAVVLANDATGSFSNCTFSGNNGRQGGALYLQGNAGVSCTSCTFSGNTATSASGNSQGGGAVYMNSSSGSAATKTFTSCTFSGNSSASGAGALYIDGYTNYTLTTCTLTGNHATEGGAIRTTGSTVANIKGCTFGGSTSGASNYATAGYGGAIYALSASNVTIADSGSTHTQFEGNYASSWGGAMYCSSTNALTCSGARFIGNHSDATSGNVYGGAVALFTKDATLALTDCVFNSNYNAVYGGSALSYNGGSSASGSLTVTNTQFTGNYNKYDTDDGTSATYALHCGAVRLGNDGPPCTFTGCTFTDNHPGSDATKVKDRNNRSMWGGAICFYGDAPVYLNTCHFDGNYATSGGAISAWNCGGKLYMNACSFDGNKIGERHGTTIRFEYSVRLCMNNCSFYDNTESTWSSISGGSGGDRASWIYLQGNNANNDTTEEGNTSGARRIEKFVFSNCSLIASSGKQINSTTGDQEIIYVRSTKDGSDYYGYFINNLIINDGGSSKYSDWWMNLASAYGFNNVYGSYHGVSSGRGSYSGTNDTSGKTISNLGTLSWTNNTWQWTGSLGHTAISSSTFDDQLNNADSAFKTWLTNIGAIHKNQLGADRGSTNWRPGAW